jgi:uncharacterized protein (DUF2345 family)
VQIAAKQMLEIKSANGSINIAAGKRVVLAVSGGASIIIENGNVTFACPGKIMVQAGKKSMIGSGTMSWQMPSMPQSVCITCLLSAAKAGSPFATRG